VNINFLSPILKKSNVHREDEELTPQRIPGDVWIGNKLACTFRDETDPTMPPLPVILISTGRAGSSVTWDTVTRLIGKPNVAFEYTGGNRTKSQIFFDSINPKVGDQWASLELCRIQAHERVEGSGICGSYAFCLLIKRCCFCISKHLS